MQILMVLNSMLYLFLFFIFSFLWRIDVLGVSRISLVTSGFSLGKVREVVIVHHIEKIDEHVVKYV